MKKIIQLIIFCAICTTAFTQNKINQYEYWFDNSYNTKITTNITPIKDFELISDISPNTLSDGLHIIHFRFRDSQNNYSSAISKYFMKVNPSQLLSDKKITAYEYWYDNKYQLKVFRAIVPSKEFALSTMLDVNSLTEGLHTISARFQDNGGNWSSLTTRYFYKKEKILTNNLIEAYEYWFDNQNQNRNLVVIYPTNESELIVDINTYGLTSTQPKFHIRFKDTRGNWSSVFTKTFIKTSIGSPTVNLTTRIVDPNPTLINVNGRIINNPSLAVSLNSNRVSASTDGVTKLLLITESDSVLNYRIVIGSTIINTNGSFGTLATPDQKLSSINITPVNVNGKNVCIAVYTVPDSWDENYLYDRVAAIQITPINDLTNIRTEVIGLKPPPLLLVHGMWGSPTSWTDGGFLKSFVLSGYESDRVILVDYSQHSASSFNPYKNSNFGLKKIDFAVTSTLEKLRQNKHACTQVDIVGHSLGGLIANTG